MFNGLLQSAQSVHTRKIFFSFDVEMDEGSSTSSKEIQKDEILRKNVRLFILLRSKISEIYKHITQYYLTTWHSSAR